MRNMQLQCLKTAGAGLHSHADGAVSAGYCRKEQVPPQDQRHQSRQHHTRQRELRAHRRHPRSQDTHHASQVLTLPLAYISLSLTPCEKTKQNTFIFIAHPIRRASLTLLHPREQNAWETQFGNLTIVQGAAQHSSPSQSNLSAATHLPLLTSPAG